MIRLPEDQEPIWYLIREIVIEVNSLTKQVEKLEDDVAYLRKEVNKCK